MASSPDLAEIVSRKNNSHKSLPEADALRYGTFIPTFFDNAESSLTLVQVHKVEKGRHVIEEFVRRRVCITGLSNAGTEMSKTAMMALSNGLISYVKRAAS